MLKVFAAVSAVALIAGAAQAQDAAQSVETPVAGVEAGVSTSTFTDAQLQAFSTAMGRMSAVATAVGSGTPTAEQQAEMAAAVEASGLGVEQFNAISTAVSSDAALRARLAVIDAPEPAAGSVAAGVTDTEVQQFATTMAQVRTIVPNGGQPTTEQQAQMAAAVESSGLTLNRFNEISTAVSADAKLRARVELADAQRGG